jgi:hypothetical protein
MRVIGMSRLTARCGSPTVDCVAVVVVCEFDGLKASESIAGRAIAARNLAVIGAPKI